MVAAGWMMGRPNLYKAGLYSATALAAVMALGALRGVAGLLGGGFSGPSLIQFALFVGAILFLVLAVREVLAGRRGREPARPRG